MQDSYRAARETTRLYAKSFYFASVALPKTKREHAYAIYAFCRYVDDEVDEVDEAGDGQMLKDKVADLKAFVESACAGKLLWEQYQSHPWLGAFLDTVHACDIPVSYFLDLLRGMEMDCGIVRMTCWEDLRDYCYYVASVVGLMMTRVFGLEDRAFEARAVDLGIAMQLTNILRDVKEDHARGRIYLPQDELEHYGLSSADLAGGMVDERWRRFMQFQISRAREYYSRSESGIRALPGDGSRLTVCLMRDIYAGILDEIEAAGYDIYQKRCHVSFPRKCVLALRALGRAR